MKICTLNIELRQGLLSSIQNKTLGKMKLVDSDDDFYTGNLKPEPNKKVDISLYFSKYKKIDQQKING